MEVKPFTFVGATTRAGLISAPLRARFGIVLRLEFYTAEDLRVIIQRSAEILGVEIDHAGAMELAGRSRGTPRIANRLLRRVRDYAQVRGAGKIDLPTAQAALQMLEVDQYGFDEVDRRLLLTIIEKYQGGPVGVNTLAAVLAEEPDAIEEIYDLVGEVLPEEQTRQFLARENKTRERHSRLKGMRFQSRLQPRG